MSFVKGLRCRECGKEYPARLQAGCEDCFAPLEVDYDYAAVAKSLTQERIASRPANLWRYRELLPLEAEPVVDFSRLSEVLIVMSGEENCKPGGAGER